MRAWFRRRWMALRFLSVWAATGKFTCKKCGGPLRKMIPADLKPGVLEAHRRAGTYADLFAFGHTCGRCPGECVLIC